MRSTAIDRSPDCDKGRALNGAGVALRRGQVSACARRGRPPACQQMA